MADDVAALVAEVRELASGTMMERPLSRLCDAVERLQGELGQFKRWLTGTQEQSEWEVVDLWKRFRGAESERDAALKEIERLRGELDAEDCAHSDEIAAHQETLRMLASSRAEVERLEAKLAAQAIALDLMKSTIAAERARREKLEAEMRSIIEFASSARRAARELLAECVEHNSEYGHVTNVAAYCAANPWLNVIA